MKTTFTKVVLTVGDNRGTQPLRRSSEANVKGIELHEQFVNESLKRPEKPRKHDKRAMNVWNNWESLSDKAKIKVNVAKFARDLGYSILRMEVL